jgi:hypothetical protein
MLHHDFIFFSHTQTFTLIRMDLNAHSLLKFLLDFLYFKAKWSDWNFVRKELRSDCSVWRWQCRGRFWNHSTSWILLSILDSLWFFILSTSTHIIKVLSSRSYFSLFFFFFKVSRLTICHVLHLLSQTKNFMFELHRFLPFYFCFSFLCDKPRKRKYNKTTLIVVY